MRIRSAVTASFLAAGILLGGAGSALAGGGVDIDQFSAGHKAFASECSTTAAVPAKFGPIYASNCAKGGESEWLKGAHLGAS
ncbi:MULTISPECIES: hypothetical protein [unclassified Streptomyces]|uniref:hypothetical protein n=1 Tax=unclassified Streptomyces TaxID=2593676 RepID=UPI002E119F97|nr:MULTISPECIES: hypothetical protein [unclassified Streptomyces]WSR24055.1 hypothetical protein OG573_36655 [Streptomyces sp. NBC_01205]